MVGRNRLPVCTSRKVMLVDKGSHVAIHFFQGNACILRTSEIHKSKSATPTLIVSHYHSACDLTKLYEWCFQALLIDCTPYVLHIEVEKLARFCCSILSCR